MKKTDFNINQKEPDLHVNTPPEKKLWQKQGPFSLWYFIIMFLLFYMFQSSLQIKREEIPYSQFMKYLQAGQVSECVIK